MFIIVYTWLNFHGLTPKIDRDGPSFPVFGVTITLTQQPTTWISYLSSLQRYFFDILVALCLYC